MRWFARMAVAAVAMLALAIPITATTAQASGQASAQATIQSSCHYTVNGDGVAVRRSPDINSYVIKRKNRGDRVTGPCQDYYNGRWWTRVYLAEGGTGWMASAYLLYNGR